MLCSPESQVPIFATLSSPPQNPVKRHTKLGPGLEEGGDEEVCFKGAYMYMCRSSQGLDFSPIPNGGALPKVEFRPFRTHAIHVQHSKNQTLFILGLPYSYSHAVCEYTDTVGEAYRKCTELLLFWHI